MPNEIEKKNKCKTVSDPNWLTYLIVSLDSKCTYVGSTNNMPRRLNNHNNTSKSRTGAKRTRGQTWSPVVTISGFNNKIECLSFEAGWKRLAKYRSNRKLALINLASWSRATAESPASNMTLCYVADTLWNRIIDLLYFVHNFTYIGHKFKLNHQLKYPFNPPNFLTINIFLNDWIDDLPWPFFIKRSLAHVHE